MRAYMNTLARAILYGTSIDVTRGHKVASRRILVIMVLYNNWKLVAILNSWAYRIEDRQVNYARIEQTGLLTDTQYQK